MQGKHKYISNEKKKHEYIVSLSITVEHNSVVTVRSFQPKQILKIGINFRYHQILAAHLKAIFI